MSIPSNPCFDYAISLTKKVMGKKIPLNQILEHNYPQYYQKMQETLDQFNATAPSPITCKIHCDACCHYQVASVPMEAKYIQYHAKKMLPRKQYKAIYRNLRKVHTKERQIETRFPNDIIRQARVYRRFKIPCPFLNDDRQCLIYSYRPMICRYHNVISSPDKCYSFKEINQVQPWKHRHLMESDVHFQKFMSQLYLNTEKQGSLTRLLIEAGF
jgi:Fe-S-cluster containining protein